MKKTQLLTIALCTLGLSSTQAAIVFSDTFDYAGDMIAVGGWTAHNGGDLSTNGAGNAIGQGTVANDNWAEFHYGTTLGEGDMLGITGNVERAGAGYTYITEIFLWDGSTATSVAGGGGVQGTNAMTPVSYTVSAGDITAGRNQVRFRFGHGGDSNTGWGETRDIAFDVTPNPVPEPASTALIGLGGLALILRRRK